MSGGRVELGIGAGWHEDEHRRHGLDFYDRETRIEMMEEQFQVISGLWTSDPGWSFEGKHYVVHDCGLVWPVQEPRPPLIMGTKGANRGLRAAADGRTISMSTPWIWSLPLTHSIVSSRFAKRSAATMATWSVPCSVASLWGLTAQRRTSADRSLRRHSGSAVSLSGRRPALARGSPALRMRPSDVYVSSLVPVPTSSCFKTSCHLM